MKTDIHPKYFESVEIRCSCGNVVIAGSTKETLKTELCSKCHPFYTGQQKLIDTAGRVDKFAARMKRSAALKDAAQKRVEAKKKKPEVYQEKIVPVEVIEKAMKVEKPAGKWGGPIGDAPAQEVVKEEIAEAKKAKLTVKKTPAAKVKAPKKSSTKPKTASKKPTVKKKSAKK